MAATAGMAEVCTLTSFPQPGEAIGDGELHICECASTAGGRTIRAKETAQSSFASRFLMELANAQWVEWEQEAGAPLRTHLFQEGVAAFPDRGDRLFRNQYRRCKGSIRKLVFRCSVSMLQVAPGRCGHVEATWTELMQRRQNCSFSDKPMVAEETPVGDEDGCAFWIAMIVMDCGVGLPSDKEGVMVKPGIILFFRRFLLPPRGSRSS